jgi:N-acetylglutamate synthase-like GNAT family acetyltransferase
MFLRKADLSEIPVIWEILKQAIEQRRLDGSDQWQNGYPNEKIIQQDISKGYGYVLEDNQIIIAYSAIIFEEEPAYTQIQGNWLTNNEYLVIHRVAVSNTVKGRGVATQLFKLIEILSMEYKVYSIKVDTNFDNVPMLKILNNLGYSYCGQVYFNGSARRAYEKVLLKADKI